MSNGAAVLAIKRKKLYHAFRTAGATSAANAKSVQELQVTESRMFNRLVGRGEIVEAGDGRYYLDDSTVQAGRRVRIMLILGFIAVAVFVGIIVRTWSN